MRKLAFSLTVIVSFLLGTGIAVASTNGPHGNYSADTNACGQCHSTHTAQAPNLIAFTLDGVDNSVYETCVFCHKLGGASKYDVVNGAIRTTDAAGNPVVYRASGGGFINVVTVEGDLATYQMAPVTSAHDVKSQSVTGAPGGDPNTTFTKSCSNCHDPHGTPNSRQLLSTVNGVTGLAPTLTVTNPLGDETVEYNSGFNDFCGACHTDFNVTTAGSGDINTGIYTSYKRHRVGMDPSTLPNYNPNNGLPLEKNGTNPGVVSCMTCHYAHGTEKVSTITWTRSNGGTSTSSALLRMNERGVCQACHNK
ncbi:putative multiheme cytochrome c [Thermincola ferriacetica]|uniref:Putative multiheme cytochrome c n=1 Tax=Thermincola ferriacetica TaxID=281456 RepID=A0A0L6VZB2_9FIRM|nr:cytochrome c3 family protein [Thermincola ferriacetica]KNZ68551.1 putative multiheme cytochrome c [Thermincola ferriacetica]